jgi:hypothetical protein
MTMASANRASREQTSPAPTSRLLDVLQQTAADRRQSEEIIRVYWDRTTWFIPLHGKRHPRGLDERRGRSVSRARGPDGQGCSPGERRRTRNRRSAGRPGNAALEVVWQQELWKRSMPPQRHCEGVATMIRPIRITGWNLTTYKLGI